MVDSMSFLASSESAVHGIPTLWETQTLIVFDF